MAASRGWHEVYKEVVRLCDTLERIPEKCECGDAETHLNGGCRCCHGHVAESIGSPGQPLCGERIALLRADLTLLCEDFKQAAGPVQRDAKGGGRMDLRRDLFMAAGDLGRMLGSLEELDRAVVGFQRSCSMANMKQVKRHSTSLLALCKRVDAELATMPTGDSEIEPSEEE